MSEVFEVPEVIADQVAIAEGGEIVLQTEPGYPDYRSYTMHHPSDELDRIHYMSSYNLRYDPVNESWDKDVAGKAGFHLAMESEWQDTIEWNLDHTLRNDANIRRIMGMMCHVDTGLTHWTWATDLVKNMALWLGVAHPTTAEWRGTSDDSAVCLSARNDSPSGAAYVGVYNSSGLAGQIQAPAAQTPHSIAGLPLANSFLVLGASGRTVVGTEAAAPLNFVTGTEHRGGIRADGAWYQVHGGVEHVMPHDPVPWSTLFPPMRAGCAYQPQFVGTRGKAQLTADTASAAPFVVPRATAFDQLSLEITTAVAGSTVRLGIYADDGAGRPGALVLDAGTVNASGIGAKTISASITLQPGLYWLAAAARGGSPTIRTGVGGGGWMIPQPATGDAIHNGYTGPHPADSLAATFTQTGTTANAPLILLRAA